MIANALFDRDAPDLIGLGIDPYLVEHFRRLAFADGEGDERDPPEAPEVLLLEPLAPQTRGNHCDQLVHASFVFGVIEIGRPHTFISKRKVCRKSGWQFDISS